MALRGLRIDLQSGQARELTPPAAWRRFLLGGRGWAARLLADLPRELSPQSVDNLLIIAAGPLAGTPAVGAGGVWVSTLSPITGVIGHSWAAGDFGSALRQSGYDILIISGESADWCILELSPNFRIRSAAEIVGQETVVADQLLRQGNATLHTLVLGPAGEAKVAYAAPVVDGSYMLEPAGAGAVMAQKRIKAVLVAEAAPLAVADPAALQRVDELYTRRCAADALTSDFVRFGSAMYINLANDRGAVTARNGQDGIFAGMLALSRTTLAMRGRQTGTGCTNSPVPCHATFTTRDGTSMGRPELTALLGFGARCGIADLETVSSAGQLCLRLGLDITATAAALAFLMECQQRDLHVTPPLPWGDGPTLLDTISKIASRQGIGGVLSLGVGEMRHIFWGSIEWAPQVNNGALVPLDPRPLPELALHLATSSWLGDYRMAMPLAELLPQLPATVPVSTGSAIDQQVARLIWHERFAAALDAAGFCRRLGLLAYTLYPQELAEMVSAVTGEAYTVGDLAKIGERIVTLERLVLRQRGGQDALPARWRSTPLADGPAAGVLPPLDMLLPAYYAAHGWEPDGTPPPARLRALHLMRP